MEKIKTFNRAEALQVGDILLIKQDRRVIIRRKHTSGYYVSEIDDLTEDFSTEEYLISFNELINGYIL